VAPHPLTHQIQRFPLLTHLNWMANHNETVPTTVAWRMSGCIMVSGQETVSFWVAVLCNSSFLVHHLKGYLYVITWANHYGWPIQVVIFFYWPFSSLDIILCIFIGPSSVSPYLKVELHSSPTYKPCWFKWRSTHQCTIHWMPIMTQLWMSLNWVNIRFQLGKSILLEVGHIHMGR
jgi:hypothetical protein